MFPLWRATALLSGAHLGPRVVLKGRALVDKHPGSTISIGDGSVLVSDPFLTALGVAKPVILRTLKVGARIEIGQNCGLSGTTICAAQSVQIGSGVLIGSNVTIVDTDFHSVKNTANRNALDPSEVRDAAVVIEDQVFIGMNATILKGVRVGFGSTIAAGSVVTTDVPSGCVVAGVPAVVVKRIG